jgi:uncharacterized RDD family membrane protein YckC
MRWLWFVGPFLVLCTYLAIVLTSTREDARRKRELNKWIDELLGPLLEKKKKLSRRVRALPPAFERMAEAAGGGARVADVVLVPQFSYVAVRAADGVAASAQQTVICKLKKRAPKLVCRPLPIIDGRPIENRGLIIDEGFCQSFIVEGDELKPARKWIDADVRAILLESPTVWLRTDGDMMAVTRYGEIDADQMDELVATADALFAQYGASDRSLFGDTPRPASEAKGSDEKASYRAKPTKPREAKPVAMIASPELRLKAGAIDFALYGVASLLLALANGSIASFHPMTLFNNPDPVVREPWQGGFTTKGMGAFTAALCLLVGLFAYQAYLAATEGRSIGKRIVGLRVVRSDDRPVDFLHGVLLRSWLFGAIALAVAAISTRPFATGAFFAKVLTFWPMATGAGVVALAVATLSRDHDHRGAHDRVADTKVVEADPVRVPSVQLAAMRGMDPIVFGQAMRAAALIGVLVVAVLLVFNFGIKVDGANGRSLIPQEALGLLVFIPLIGYWLMVRFSGPTRSG